MEVAKQRWKYGVICNFREDPFNLKQVSDFPKVKETVKGTRYPVANLYKTKHVKDEVTGRTVMETAV